MRIDVHAHYWTRESLDKITALGKTDAAVGYWRPMRSPYSARGSSPKPANQRRGDVDVAKIAIVGRATSA